ncbi:MAG: TonB-dependent receptor [Bacteroidia bacterium]|nr:TonB-dependent receptor [Bacteroidia bacterium]MDW8302361.1 TonB-dependent receptor [Bacteroidia bacterium]
MRCLGIVILCVGISFFSQAQQEKIIYGKILNEQKQPIQGAIVCIKGTNLCTESDSLGRYELKHLCQDTCQVLCSFLGYATDVKQIKVKLKVQCDFILSHLATNEVHVIAEKKENYNSYAKSKLSIQDLDALRFKSISEQIATLPGVRTLKTGATISKPILHGLYGYRVLILQHGIRLEGQQWGNEHAPEIDPFLATEVEVVKGSNTVRYGADAMSGVILTEPSPILEVKQRKIQLYQVFQTQNKQYSACGIVENKLSQSLKYRIQSTAITAGSSRTPNYYLANTAFRNYNGSVALGLLKKNYDAELFYSYFYNKIGIFSASHIGNLTDLQAAFQRDKPFVIEPFTYAIQRPFQKVEHHFTKYRFRYFAPIGDFTFQVAYQNNHRQEFDLHNRNKTSKAELDLTIQTAIAELIWKHKPMLNYCLQGNIGVTGMYQYNLFGGSRYFIPEYYNQSVGIFWIEHYQKKNIEIELGLRYDTRLVSAWIWKNNIPSLREYSFNAPSGMVGFSYVFHPHWKWNLNIGTAWRMPAMNELFVNGVHHGAASYEIGNPDLKTEQGLKVITSFLHENHEKTSLNLSAYYHYIYNFIYLMPTLEPILTIRGAFPSFVYQQHHAVLYGTDIEVKHQFSKCWYVNLQQNVVRGWNTTLQTHLPLMPPDNTRIYVGYQIYKKLWLFEHTTFKVGTEYVAKQIRYMPNTEIVPPPRAYVLANIAVETRIQDRLFIHLQIDNFFNQRYRDYLNRFRYFSDEIGRNGIITLKYIF